MANICRGRSRGAEGQAKGARGEGVIVQCHVHSLHNYLARGKQWSVSAACGPGAAYGSDRPKIDLDGTEVRFMCITNVPSRS